MVRILFWIALIILVIMAVRSKAKSMVQRQPPPAAKPELDAESMACCAHCGMHFPASESVRADGLDYCSPAHVRLPPR